MSPDVEPVPLFDLRLTEADIAAVTQTLRSGWLTQGPRTEALEAAFAKFTGARHAVAVSSATAGLTLAYRAAGIGPGHEVIVPSYTFVATAAAAVHLGATPVFADIRGPHHLSLDPADVATRITPRTKAVVAVHMAGYAAPIARLRQLCDAYGVTLIEDASHAPGASVDGRALGTFGAAGVFSFFTNKVLGIGEGGMVITDDDDVAASCRRGRTHGMTSSTWERRHSGDSYDVTEFAWNLRMDEPRAALALSRLAGIEDDVRSRREHVVAYRTALATIDGIDVPYTDDEVAAGACYIMPVLLRDADGAAREEVRRRLRGEHAVETSHHYPPVHRFTAVRERWTPPSLPRTEHAADRELTLPLFPGMTVQQRERVVAGLSAVLG